MLLESKLHGEKTLQSVLTEFQTLGAMKIHLLQGAE